MTTNALTFINTNSFQITNSTKEKLLGIKFYSKLSFKHHVSILCKEASQKLHTLTKIVDYMNLSKRKVFMYIFVITQFNYCLLVWMFHCRKLNHVSIAYMTAHRVASQDCKSTFLELLQRDNLQDVATDIFKGKNDLLPKIMK